MLVFVSGKGIFCSLPNLDIIFVIWRLYNEISISQKDCSGGPNSIFLTFTFHNFFLQIPGSSTRRTRPIDSRSTGAALRERTERRLSGPRLGNHHPHATMGGHGTPAPAPAPPAPTPPASGLRRGGDWTGHLVDHLAAPSPATNAPTPTPSHTPTYKSLYLQRKRYSDPKTQDASEVPGSGYLLRSPLPVPGAETGNARRKLTPSPARRRGAAGAERREWSTDSVSPPPSTAVLSVSPHRVSLGGGGGGGGGGGNLARPVGPGGEHNEHRSAF